VTEENWRTVVRERLRSIDWDRVAADVRPFLEIPGELDLLTEENVVGLLDRKHSIS
jgi:hypothetical protein